MNFEDLVWLFGNNWMNHGIIQLQFDEASLLWKIVKKTKGDILEIGRASGGSAVFMLSALGENSDRVIVSLDLKSEMNEKCKKILEFNDNVEIKVCDSNKPLEGSNKFGLIFFDGGHRYNVVHNDVCVHWNSLVSVNGSTPIAVFHDSIPLRLQKNKELGEKLKIVGMKGPNTVCKELEEQGYAKEIDYIGSMVVYEKLKNLDDSWKIIVK